MAADGILSGPIDLDRGAGRPRVAPPTVAATAGLVLTERATGARVVVVAFAAGTVTVRDGFGATAELRDHPGRFAVDGRAVTLGPAGGTGPTPARTASGSIAGPRQPARVARASRILVEGVHDAELLERVWGDDLRHEGIVVERLDGVDHLDAELRSFRPGPGRRLGVLLDHLVDGTKEARAAAAATAGSEHVLVTGHPYVDVWQAVKPAAVGIAAWPDVPMGVDWKTGVCAALGEPDPRAFWRRVLSSVAGWTDLETPLVNAVERLIDFVSEA